MSATLDEHGETDSHRLVADINVTPFVDVMLVLLIVFMVTAPMLAAGVKVDLPKAAGLPPVEQRREPLILSVRADGTLFLGQEAMTSDALAQAVRSRLDAQPDLIAHLRADAAVPYDKVLAAMAILSDAGAARIAFIGRPADTVP
jgi:biopolymer transport protein TolR